MVSKDLSKNIFSNPIPKHQHTKACKNKAKFLKRFGDDSLTDYPLAVSPNESLNPYIGIQNIILDKSGSAQSIDFGKGIIIGNIRMGFGHYRIAMAIASAAFYLGYTPYWFDLHSYQETTGGKIIAHLNKLYSLGSRWSQKYKLFNKLYWEPLNSEGFKRLSYNSMDQKMTELMTPIYKNIPKGTPFIATHVWPAQAAVHAGIERVVNVVPDNWPMALHLAEGSIHTVQTPSSYFGYKTLKGMAGDQILKPIPEDQIYEVGHYVDHEIVSNLEQDCACRKSRIKEGKPIRILITVGGAGAQKEIFEDIITAMTPRVREGKVTLLVNFGDHQTLRDDIYKELPQVHDLVVSHNDDWEDTVNMFNDLSEMDKKGIHFFYHRDIFTAVYSTNLMMRVSDVLVTKPSELSFYPIPKLLIKRVGGHEAYGAIRASEIGDGTIECDSKGFALQMLGLLLDDGVTLDRMNDYILRANSIGLYNGAYKAVELALQRE